MKRDTFAPLFTIDGSPARVRAIGFTTHHTGTGTFMNTVESLNTVLGDRYRIARELGAGGMATVYLAHDLKHERDVALKVLHPDLAAALGPERFLAEIKTMAKLQHAHILPLLDSGEAAGALFYVMPVVTGETLRARLERELQLPIDDAVRITIEVASALDYAHRQGVIHRDIKPENILLHEGQALVADFGIALALSVAGGQRMTQTGMSLGTPHYMSPEQAMGQRTIDARSDVYSLGAVLYEMLTGEPPFTGASAQAIVAKAMTERPMPPHTVRETVPFGIEAAALKALAKLPADRFASAAEFAAALSNQAAVTQPYVHAAATELGAARRWRGVAYGAIALTIVTLATSVWILRRASARPGPVVTRVDLDQDFGENAVAISPDGSMLAYRKWHRAGGTYSLVLRRSSVSAATEIPGTTEPYIGGELAFSPDGVSIAYTTSGQVKSVPVIGGAASVVTSDSSGIYNVRWCDNGMLYYNNPQGVFRVAQSGGAATRLLADNYSVSDVLSGGQLVLLVRRGARDSLVTLDVASGKTSSLHLGGTAARFVAPGHLLVWESAGVFAVRFDARRGAITGKPVLVLDSLSTGGFVQEFAVSATGTAVYLVTATPLTRQLTSIVVVDASGREQTLPLPPSSYSRVHFSPDGGRLVFDSEVGIQVYDFVLRTTTRLPVDSGGAWDPVWNMRGDRIAYLTRRDSATAVAWRPAADTGRAEELFRRPDMASVWLYGFSPDDKRLLFGFGDGGFGAADLGVATFADKWHADAYIRADYDNFPGASLSPDGRWAAYRAMEPAGTGVNRMVDGIYVRSFPSPGERVAIRGGPDGAPTWPTDPAARPLWGKDGHSIFAIEGDSLFSYRIRTDPSVAVLSRSAVMSMRPYLQHDFDVHPDGKRFVMLRIIRETPADSARRSMPPRLVLVVNWIEEMKRKIAEAKR